MSKQNNVSEDLPKQELLSMVVNPDCQSGGHAENLIKALCIHFRAHSTGSFRIVVGSSLARAHGFYVKMGCMPVKEIQVHKGSNSVVYIKQCS